MTCDCELIQCLKKERDTTFSWVEEAEEAYRKEQLEEDKREKAERLSGEWYEDYTDYVETEETFQYTIQLDDDPTTKIMTTQATTKKILRRENENQTNKGREKELADEKAKHGVERITTAERERADEKKSAREKTKKEKKEMERVENLERGNVAKIAEGAKTSNGRKQPPHDGGTTPAKINTERKTEERHTTAKSNTCSGNKWWEEELTEAPTATTHHFTPKNVSIIQLVTEFEIVPDILDISPERGIQITYSSNSSVYYGNFLSEEELRVEPVTLSWAANASRYYTLLLSGPDMPAREYPLQREWLHWLVGNVRGNVWGTGDVLAKYMAPFAGRDTRRLVFLVFEQRNKIDYENKLFPLEERGSYTKPTILRPLFSTRDFMKQMELSNPVAINFFQIKPNEII
ncbi:uncharacterized protein [Bemisia tabaci]|uniref:uncharacterized protein isoform X2 n=1 Tax=Bemisia tabaci TaxID=7038 RepID=UPI003B27D9E2